MNIEFHRTRSRPNEEVNFLLFVRCIMQPHNLETRETAPSNNCTVKLKMPRLSCPPIWLIEIQRQWALHFTSSSLARARAWPPNRLRWDFFQFHFYCCTYFFSRKEQHRKAHRREREKLPANRCTSSLLQRRSEAFSELITNCAMNQRKKQAGKRRKKCSKLSLLMNAIILTLRIPNL